MRQPEIVRGAVRLGPQSGTLIDDEIREIIDEAARSNYQRGLAEGGRRAVAAIENSRNRAIELLEIAVTDAERRIERTLGLHSEAVIEMAIEMARLICGSLVEHTSERLQERIKEALDMIDDDPLVVLVSSVDHDAVSNLLSNTPQISVTVNGTLGPGEATIRGRWADADLTLTALKDAMIEGLNA